METFVNDLKYSLRMLRKNPGFTATAVAALALGIGANTAIFSVVNAVLLRPLPYPQPERIVQIVHVAPNGNFGGASVPKYNAWREAGDVLEDVAAYDIGGPGMNLTGGDRPEQVQGIRVSHEYFSLFGARAILGRTFSAEEDRPGGARVAVIASGLWKRHFGGDPGVIGKPLLLGAEPYTIIGVMSPEFHPATPTDLWLAMQPDPNSVDQAHYFQAAARLKPGVTIQQANAAMGVTAARFRAKFPQQLRPNVTFGVQSLQEITVRNIRPTLLILLGAVGFVLLIACANVANLLLARANRRGPEIAIRAAIGAGRGRLIRQLLTESAVLSTLGGVLGLVLGLVGVRALVAINPGGIPRIGADGSGIAPDWTVLLFTLAIALATGILFGLAPALQASRPDLHGTLKESGARAGSGVRQNRARGLLVVTEMALAIVLLIGAGLLIRSFAGLRQVPPGFDRHNVLTMESSFTGTKYTRTAQVVAFGRQALDRIQAMPGVESAALASSLPLEPNFGLGFNVEGRPQDSPLASGGASWRYATARYFEVFRIPILRGRAFTDRDDAAGADVAIINETFAKQFFKEQDPIGQRITIGRGMGPAFAEQPREIVGVCADARDLGLNNDPGNIMYVPLAQIRDGVMALNNRIVPLKWVVRTRNEPFAVSAAVKREVESVADLAVANIRTMEQVTAESTAASEFNTTLLGIFAFLAILLASIGLYGLMAYSVEQRTVEFGIRLALGADFGGLRNMVLLQAMKLAVVGIAIGLVAARFLTKFMATLLFGVRPNDPIVFATVAGSLALVALLAAYIPARRALKIDPIVALRYQ
jgi:putative ABC transport system permease protein